MSITDILLARLDGQIWDGCRRRSVVRCPSRGHISKTKQDRPVVTVERYTDVGTSCRIQILALQTKARWYVAYVLYFF